MFTASVETTLMRVVNFVFKEISAVFGCLSQQTSKTFLGNKRLKHVTNVDDHKLVDPGGDQAISFEERTSLEEASERLGK